MYVLLLLLSILVNWLLGSFVGAGRPHRQAAMTAAVLFNIAGLFVFKYPGFVCQNM